MAGPVGGEIGIMIRTITGKVVLPVVLSGVILGGAGLFAESVASLNREGNRLFSEGKYADAEKAYVDAQAKSPGKPELLYNHGNTLIQEKKYDPAVQQLHQAVSKGDRGIQASSWYNSGNALFEMGRYQDAAQAYIQSLRINPADPDAKHNLELALRKSREKKQQQGGGNGQQNQQREHNQQQPAPKDQQQPQSDQQPKPADSQERNKPANPQATQAERREGSFSKEQALQILDALQNQELVDQKKRLERIERRKAVGKDW
jgi:Ca-activated chloride channel family protein